MTDTNRQWTLARRPEGKPVGENFELIEADVPEPGDDEVLVRIQYLSVDPYMRDRMRDAESYAEPWKVGEVLRAAAVGEVVESNHPMHAEGDLVTGGLQWADYAVASGDRLSTVDIGDAPVSTALGVLGIPGRTAYFGMLDVVEPRPGDTVVVSGAAGAVGSVAGQIAKLAGATVVGIAGSEEKIDFVTDEWGMDAGVNYREEDVGERLDALTDGIDVYFDNVGGEITDAVMDRLAVGATVAVCGQIALYNEEETPTGPRHFGKLIGKRARVEGFLVGDYAHRTDEATERLSSWVAGGDVAYRETITDGLENAPDAFIGLFEGENVGKQLVRIR